MDNDAGLQKGKVGKMVGGKGENGKWEWVVSIEA